MPGGLATDSARHFLTDLEWQKRRSVSDAAETHVEDYTGAGTRPIFSRKEKSMLILSRREGEFIRIGENIDVVVSRLAGGRVVIGVEAPAEVKVLRGELVPDSPVKRDEGCEGK